VVRRHRKRSSDFETAPAWLAAWFGVFYEELAWRHGRARRIQRSGNGALSLLGWGRKYLPHHFTRPASAMHRWLAAHLDRMWHRRGTKLNVLGPRGGAKSTRGTLACPLVAAVSRFEPYVWSVSDTKQQAYAHLENLKAELVDNPRLAADYPDAAGRGPVWRKGSIVLNNGVAIEAFGTGQRLRGRRYRADRPTLILCDDLENDDHMQSAARRDRSRSWFHGTLLKAGTVGTNVVNLATALHRDALAMRLCRTPGWTSRVFRAIQRWPRNMSIWQRWEEIYADFENTRAKQLARAFYETHRHEMDEGAGLLWPEWEDLYTLMCMRVESGRTAFEREKQNSPVNPELCEWPETYFHGSIWFDTWPEDLRVKVLALDPSKGADARRGDYSAFVIVADGVEIYRRFQPDAFGVEANQFQDLLAGQFEAEFHSQGILGARPWTLDNRVNKLVRIRRLGPYLSSRRLRFKAGCASTRLLVDQLQEFPVSDHDDGPDAAEMAVRLAADLLGARTAADGLGHRLPVG